MTALCTSRNGQVVAFWNWKPAAATAWPFLRWIGEAVSPLQFCQSLDVITSASIIARARLSFSLYGMMGILTVCCMWPGRGAVILAGFLFMTVGFRLGLRRWKCREWVVPGESFGRFDIIQNSLWWLF